MSDNFNAHEILMKLRGVGNIAQSTNNAAQVNRGIKTQNQVKTNAQSNNSSAPLNPYANLQVYANSNDGNQSLGSTTGNSTYSEMINQNQGGLIASGSIMGLGNMPPSPGYTSPTQRREYLEIRTELEREIKRLQIEVMELKNDNKALHHENIDMKKQLHEHKEKSDECVAKLRNKIAIMKDKIDEHKVITERRVETMTSMGILGMAAPAHANNFIYTGGILKRHNKEGARARTPRGDRPSSPSPSPMPPLPPPPLLASSPNPNSNQINSFYASGSNLLGASFAEPTFSELMRRSTPNTKDFQESLRRPVSQYPPMYSNVSNRLSMQGSVGNNNMMNNSYNLHHTDEQIQQGYHGNGINNGDMSMHIGREDYYNNGNNSYQISPGSGGGGGGSLHINNLGGGAGSNNNVNNNESTNNRRGGLRGSIFSVPSPEEFNNGGGGGRQGPGHGGYEYNNNNNNGSNTTSRPPQEQEEDEDDYEDYPVVEIDLR